MISFNNKNKKSMEMSINLIIMLVLGLTVLGLIISFVTGFIGDASKSFGGQLGEDDKNKLDQVLNENGNFVIQPRTLKVKKGDKKATKLYVKIRNPSDNKFTSSNGNLVGRAVANPLIIDISNGRGVSTLVTGAIEVITAPISLKGGEEKSYSLEVYANSNAPIGTYYLKFIILYKTDITETEIVTLNVY
jgi:hypothetical protein